MLTARWTRIGIMFVITMLGRSGLAQPEHPMMFRESDFLGMPIAILAEGDITSDTPGQFSRFIKEHDLKGIMPRDTVLLNSLGGDLVGGVKLGLEIRQAGLNTEVASPKNGWGAPGMCASACTFAFLGGVNRTIFEGSHFGVHRYWSSPSAGGANSTPNGAVVEQGTQIFAGGLVAYIREMGVSSELYTLMTTAGKGSQEEILWLDPATLARLNVTTTGKVEVKMSSEGGVSVLHLTDMLMGGKITGELDFYCKGPWLVARVQENAFRGPGQTEGFSLPQEASAHWIFVGTGADVDLPLWNTPAENIRFLGRSPKSPEAPFGVLWFEIYVPADVLNNRLERAKEITVSASAPAPDYGQGPFIDISSPIPDTFRTLLRTLADSCH